ncbi:ADP-ribosylglycohydrolase family protein [Rossellomorea marisflavi]|uniref:ADP-ribosylglycohydrolase family protein n=1 Tax=Rossellomorea marisflavi TaxID=189381 RepID=UPI003D2EC0EB
MTTLDKVEFIDMYFGSLLGAVVGDALGWPQEDRSSKMGEPFKPSAQLKSWRRRNGLRDYYYEEVIGAGSYSDDSQLIFATARSLKKNNWFSHFVKVELPTWPAYERGGGGATKRAALMWSKAIRPWKNDQKANLKKYFEAGGNGVAMRISPHVYYNSDNLDEITQQVFLNGIATHGHPRALLSSILYAWALQYLVKKDSSLDYGELVQYLLIEKGKWSKFPKMNKLDDWLEAANIYTNDNYAEIWDNTANELVEGLEIIKEAIENGVIDKTTETLNKLKCFDSRVRGAGTVACLVSIYIASKYAADPEKGLMRIAFCQKSDADTNASMVGGLLGAIKGTEWIVEEWYKVQDYIYIKKLVSDFSKDKEDNNSKLWASGEKIKLLDKMEKANIKEEKFDFGPFKDLSIIEVIKNRSINQNGYSKSYKLLSSEGQTIFIKDTKVKKENEQSKEKQIKANSNPIPAFLAKLQSIVSPRLTAKKILDISLVIFSDIQQDKINFNNVSEKKAYIQKLTKKGLDENLVSDLVDMIIQTSMDK